jgi:two-component system OmpR family sensor kinase
MNKLPIRLRVTAAFALAMAAVLAGSGLFLYLRLDAHLSRALDRDLQLRAQDLVALVGQPNASLASESSGRFVETGENYAQLIDAKRRVVDATRPLGPAPILDTTALQAALRNAIYANFGPVPGLDEPSRVLASPVQRAGRHFVLVVGTTLQNRAETLTRFREELLVTGPIALLLASLAGYMLAGLSLRQVETMRKRAATITAETSGERLPVPPTGDELERLGTTLNEMLDRLETALQRERDFVADAGHELRTPLALLRTELELALRQAESPEELKEAIRTSSQEADRLSQLAEGLLLIASSDRGRVPLRLEELQVDELFATVRSRFQWRAEQANRVVAIHSTPGVRIRGDRLRLEQALGNLVDNALRYGVGTIDLSAKTTDGSMELHVADEGDGFPVDFVPRAFDRFTQADRARSRDGAGLGLSIVSAIAAAHGGTAHASNLAEGGADVWIRLPI